MTKNVTEADVAVAVAEAFGGTPPRWATEARKQELKEAGEPTMSVNEALDVVCGAAFGRVDVSRVTEAEAVLGRTRESSSRPDLHGRMTTLMNEMTSLAQSRFGYSIERARLYAQDQALECRELAGPVSEAVSRLEQRRDSLITRPLASKRSI